MKNRAELREMCNRMFAAGSDVIQAAALTRTTPGDYDPNTGAPGTPTVTTDSGKVLFTNGILAKRIAQGREVEPNSQGAYGTGFTSVYPDEGDMLVVEGRTWRVADSDNLLLAGALWELVLVPD